MSQRKTGKHPALGAPYTGTVTGRIAGKSDPEMQMQIPKKGRDIHAEVAGAIFGKLHPSIMGIDLAGKEDRTATATALRQGTRFLLWAGSSGPAQIDREWINGLDAGRKTERAALALAFETIAAAHGAKVERREEGRHPGWHSGSIDLTISCNGVGANVSFSSLHGGNHGLVSWYNDYTDRSKPCQNFSTTFNVAVRDLLQTRPHHKATTCCDDWHKLAMALDAGLRIAAAGEAFCG